MLEDVHEKVNNKFDQEWELKIEDFAQEQQNGPERPLTNGSGQLS